jgi:hypothetical protein
MLSMGQVRVKHRYYGLISLLLKQDPGQFSFSEFWVEKNMPRIYGDAMSHLETWFAENPSQRFDKAQGSLVFTFRELDILTEFSKLDGTLSIPLFDEDYEDIEDHVDQSDFLTLLNECAFLVCNR